jgi:hypothetical protein
MSEESLPSPLATAKRKLREQTCGLPGVTGWGTDGSCLRIYVRDETELARIPREVDGVAVQVVATQSISAQRSGS